MTQLAGKSKPSGQLGVVVTRADGTVQDYGVVAKSEWRWYRPWTWPSQLAARAHTRRLNRQAGV